MNSSTLSDLKMIEMFQLYYTPILVLTGVIGNGFTIFIFYKTKMRKLSSSYYLMALAFSDIIFLLILFSVWIKFWNIDVFNRPGFCQVMVYATNVCSFLSVWLVLTFTCERFVAVKYPFLRQSLCTTQRAKTSIITLGIIALIMNSPIIIFSSTTNINNVTTCSVDEKWKKVANIFNYLDFLITYLIPVTVIIYLNISISRSILNFSHVRQILVNHNAAFNEKRYKMTSFRNKISQKKITKMLLIVSTVFLFLNFPSYIMRLYTYLFELNLIHIDDMDKFQIIQHWCLQLFYTNFGINFYLYCISGQNFRKALLSMFCKRKLKRKETAPLTDSRTLSTGSSVTSRRRKMSVYIEIPDGKIRKHRNSILPE